MRTRAIAFVAALFAAGQLFAQQPKSLAVGALAPALTLDGVLQAPQGVDLSAEALRGRAVVLDFWGTWCGPCIKAIPHWNRLVDHYAGKEKDIVFLAITDDQRGALETFLRKTPMHGWIGVDPDRSTWRDFGVSTVPHTVLIRPGGEMASVLRSTNVTPELLDQLIENRKPLDAALGKFSLGVSLGNSSRRSAQQGENWVKRENSGLAGIIADAWRVRYDSIKLAPELTADFESSYDLSVRVPPGRDWTAAARPFIESTLNIVVERTEVDGPVWQLLKRQDGQPTLTRSSPSDSQNSSQGPKNFESQSATLEEVSFFLSYALGAEVRNRTGLDARYRISLNWTGEGAESVREAVKRQLGLELRSEPARIEQVHVRRATKSDVAADAGH